MISRYLRLLKVAAGRLAMLSPFWFDPEDCHGAGALALVRAVDAFDPSRGVPFEAFAYPRIYGAMVDHVRAQDWVPRGVRAAARKLKAAYYELAGKTGRPPEDKEVAARLSLSTKEFESLLRRAAHALLLPFDAVDEVASCHSPHDIIPDNVPVLGYIDDAIMIELVVSELKHEIDSFTDFCKYRAGEQARNRNIEHIALLAC